MLAQGMKGNHETKIKKTISPEGDFFFGGGVLQNFKWQWWLKDFFGCEIFDSGIFQVGKFGKYLGGLI